MRSISAVVLLVQTLAVVASLEVCQDPGAAAIDAAIDSCVARATGIGNGAGLPRRGPSRKHSAVVARSVNVKQPAHGQDPISRLRHFFGHLAHQSEDEDIARRRKVILQLQSKLHRDRFDFEREAVTEQGMKTSIRSGHLPLQPISLQNADANEFVQRPGALPSTVTWAALSRFRPCAVKQETRDTQVASREAAMIAEDEQSQQVEEDSLEVPNSPQSSSVARLQEEHARPESSMEGIATDLRSPDPVARLLEEHARLESKIERIATELKSPDVSDATQFALKKKMAMCRADARRVERKISTQKAEQVLSVAHAGQSASWSQLEVRMGCCAIRS